jgi:predicted RNase H-like nuclease (RuvC/YqgF family)
LNASAQPKNNNANHIIEQKERTMTTDPAIKQLTKERDNMAHQISNREKEIAHFNERLKSAQMPNQVAILQAQRARQVTMLDADREMLVNLETSLATEIASHL